MNKQIISLTSLIFLISCSTPTNDKGYVKLDFKFPQKISFNTKTIPDSTESLEISIQGEGLSDPLIKKISRNNSDKVFFQEVPIGLKKIKVSAFDNSSKTLATGQTDIYIKAGQINKANLELKELLKDFKIILSNYPGDGYVYAQIKTKNKVIQEEIKNNQIELKDIEPGNIDLKVTAFSNDSTPILSIEKSLDTSSSDLAEVKLDTISLPGVSDFDINTSIPFEVLGLLNKVKIDFNNNKAPKIENIELLINEKNTIPSLLASKPICVSSSDNIKINVKASDADNDKINLYWGQNSIIGNKYKMKLENERGTSLSKSGAELGSGNNSIGFILTDRKSFIGPVALYFKVQQTGCQ